MPTLLTIAGYDPSSGAGVTADLAVFQAHGLFGTSCVTALTVQSTLGVAATQPLEGGWIRRTLDHLEEDLPPAGVKIGMLGTAGGVAAVAGYLEGLRGSGRRPAVVLDPVVRASSGAALLDGAGVELLRERLLPLVDWVTPNVAELSLLSGVSLAERPGREAIERAAESLGAGYRALGLLVTGGEDDPPDDLLVAAAGGKTPSPGHWLAGEHVATTSTHGTGCALSSALLCRLVLGDAPLVAAAGAKAYVAGALRHAVAVGHGRGPMNLLWPLTGGREPGVGWGS